MPWLFNDVTTLAPGAPLASPLAFGPASYEFLKDNGSYHVIFQGFIEGQGGDGRIHELWWDNGGWHHNDLTNAAGAPLANQFSDLAAYTRKNTEQHVCYMGADNHIHELWWNGGWGHTDLTNNTGGAPLALNGPVGYANDDSQQVVYRDVGSHVHLLRYHGNSWQHHEDLTADHGGAPVLDSLRTGYFFDVQGTQHVVYQGSDNHVYELFGDSSGAWQPCSDLTVNWHAPKAKSAPIGYAFEATATQHVFYLGADDNHIYELLWDNNVWHPNDLTLRTGAPQASPAGPATGYVFVSQRTQHVFCKGTDNHIYELLWDDNGWHPYNDLTVVTGAPLAASDPSGNVFTVGQDTQHVVYTSQDHHIIELST